MADYDSDSSGMEDGDYTETNVLLGYASKEASDDTVSQLGGRPTWLDPAFPPSASLARCKVCKDLMVLLLQLNGDLPEHFPGHERRLYVLTCRRKTCRRKDGSVRALRGVRITENPTKERRKDEPREDSRQSPVQGKAVSNTGLGEALFGAKPISSSGAANPFSTSATSPITNPFSTASLTTASNPFATADFPSLSNNTTKSPKKEPDPSELPQTFASALSLNNNPPQTFGPPPPPEPWPPESEQPEPYPLYYLGDADYEVLDKVEESIPVPKQTMDIDDEGGAGSSSGNQKEDKDVFESTIDKTFQKFADRLAQNPEQVIRYEFKGQPLLYSKTDAVGKLLSPAAHAATKVTVASSAGGGKIPRCGNCGAGRVFEVQLTPHVITELEIEEMGMEGMEWGTIIVGVCERDCAAKGTAAGEVGYLEEWAGVQWEELSEKK